MEPVPVECRQPRVFAVGDGVIERVHRRRRKKQVLRLAREASSQAYGLARVVLDHELLVDGQREVLAGGQALVLARHLFGIKFQPR